MFRFVKRHVDCPPSTDEDPHRLDHVNFSCPRVFVLALEPNFVEDVHVQQLPFGFSDLLPLLY
jgi:hypothetical protein